MAAPSTATFDLTTTTIQLCDSDFWDVNITLVETPQLTQCFRSTALIWLPSLLLLLASLYEYARANSNRTSTIPWNIFNTIRCLVTLLLILFKLTETINELVKLLIQQLPKVIVVSILLGPVIQLLCHVLLFAVYLNQRNRARHTSGPIWFYLTALTLCQALEYYSIITSIGHSIDSDHLLELIVDLVHFPLVVILFCLECRGDKPPQGAYERQQDNDTNDTGQPKSPELEASFLSSILYHWFNKMLIKGYKKTLAIEDVWKLSPRDRVGEHTIRFQSSWNRAAKTMFADRKTYKLANGQRQLQQNVLTTFLKIYAARLTFAGLLKLIQDLMQYSKPLLLKLVLQYMSSSSEPHFHGIIYALMLLVIPSVQSIFLNYHYYLMVTTANRVRNAIMSAVYRKSLRTSGSSRLESTSGEMVNLMAVDAFRFYDLFNNIHYFWSSFVQLGLPILLIYRELGWAVFAGLVPMIFVMLVHSLISRYESRAQTRLMKLKDERTKQVGEVLSGIRLIKLYAWENSFMQSVCSIRKREIKNLNLVLIFDGFMEFLWNTIPFLVSLITFAVYVLQDPSHKLTPEKAFVTLALFNLLKMPLYVIPYMISLLISALVSTGRINKFLNSDELERFVEHEETQEAITIEGGNLAWISPETVTSEPESDTNQLQPAIPPTTILRDIDLHIARGSFVVIVGQVASGKSSLLAAILGEMHRLSGRFNVAKSVQLAYVPQQAWIQNMTVKQNILFDRQFDVELYQRVLDACALKPDLATLAGGDETEIGERGINLSGGQKQRVSLARACYSASDLYLLDDPLSALDSHVGRHVFEKVLSSSGGILAGKTRLLATNSLFVLPYADQIVVLKEGRIVECGTYKQLMEKQDGSLNEMMQHYGQVEESHASIEPAQQETVQRDRVGSILKPKEPIKGSATLIEDERIEVGSVTWRVYLGYFRAASLRWLTFVLLLWTLATAFSVGTNVWLSIWAGDSSDQALLGAQWWWHYLASATTTTTAKWTIWQRLGVYTLLGSVGSLLLLLGCLAQVRASVRASNMLHESLLDGVMHSPMTFFDTTPVGRIVNRFSKDIDAIDTTIPSTLSGWLGCFLEVVSGFVIIGTTFPSFLLLAMPMIVLYYFIQKAYIITQRQLKRLESVTRSPIFEHFQETLAGATTIRAYECSQRFIERSETLIDINMSAMYASVVANRWLSIRLEVFGNIVTMAAALFSIYHKDTIGASLAGLTVAYSLNVTIDLTWLIRMSTDLETNIVSAERVLEYSRNVREDLWTKPANDQALANWPSSGAINFTEFCTRYRDNTDLVLKRLNFRIEPGEKIGIVGRTGSGKSSLVLSLFRLLEAAGGRIAIDGLDIAELGLHELRSKLTVIPQDPVLFSGSIRFNLDPLEASSDDEIWQALELAHLRSQIAAMPDGLDHKVSEYGENFSQGQRQLICLARAILRKSKIFVLDEATASVDTETDALVQRTIRQSFGDCTVITIAHRLHTILDSDRVLVLDGGVVRESGPPVELAARRDGYFAGLMRDAGLQQQPPGNQSDAAGSIGNSGDLMLP